MPQVVYTPEKGLVQESGSGFSVAPEVGVTNNGFLAGFIPAVRKTASAAGAVSVASYFTALTSDGAAVAFTLANGTAVGQLKKITLAVAQTGGNTAVLTIASPESAAYNVLTFSILGDTAELIWSGTAWFVIANYNMATASNTTPTLT